MPLWMTLPEASRWGLREVPRLSLAALADLRQSSDFQVRHHVERQRLQYALADHARQLGFRDVEVIDEDQGTSGDGVLRTGFDRLVSAVCRGAVGLVLSLEASRLARNGRDWHTLLDFCAIVGCLVGDRRRLYDPAAADDRLFLGMQGNFAEAELALFRQHSRESRLALAQRSELFTHLPAGYEEAGKRRIEMTPDQRQRDALRLVFRKFAELRSVRQVWLWLRREQVEIPVGQLGQGIVWKVPTETGLYALLHDPIYAGAYAYGRRRQETWIENGRKRVRGRRGVLPSSTLGWALRLTLSNIRGDPLSLKCFNPCRYLHEPLRLLPAGATVGRAGFAPAGTQRLSTAHQNP